MSAITQIMNLVVKNTFLNLTEPQPAETRRCRSVPPEWKPAIDLHKQQLGISLVRSDTSTAATEDTCSLSDGETCGAVAVSDSDDHGADSDSLDCRSTRLSQPATPNADKVTLRLDEIVSDERGAMERTGLDPNANAFAPSALPPADVCMVIAEVQLALAGEPAVSHVRVAEGPMGGVATIVAEVPASHGGLKELHNAKTMLLEAAANSESVYILGYGAQPFVDFGDTGFKAVISHLPIAHEDSACWDTYQKGFCPRPHTCRWRHPRSADLMQVIVTLKKRETDEENDIVP